MSTYEAWRATHQDAEAAAKAAFEQVQGLAKLVDGLQAALGRQVRFGSEAGNPASGAQDAKIVDFLAKNYIGVDFRWGEHPIEAMVIKMPEWSTYSGDFRKDVTEAMAAQAQQGGAA